MGLTTRTDPSLGSDLSDTYVLNTGKSERALEQQHHIFANDSFLHLEKAGLSNGQIIWDIGCGNGAMTEYFAKAVGSSGHVYAVDMSQGQIDVAKERLNKADLGNVTFIQTDINTDADDLLGPQADIVYSRLLLMHVTNPLGVIKRMQSLLKPGGILALQETTMSTVHASFKNEPIEECSVALVALGKHKGVDYDIGAKLPNLCHQAGFPKVESYTIQHKVPISEVKPLLINRFLEWKDEAIKANLFTIDKAEELARALNLLPESDESLSLFMGKQTYVLARQD